MEERAINPEFEGLQHGITRERMINVSVYPMMICPKCEHIYWNAQMCSTPRCGRTLCEPCLKGCGEGERCEGCHKSSKYEANPFVGRSFIELTFHCVNQPKCKEILRYEELAYHICGYDQMKCPMGECEWEGERGEMSKHREECLYEEIYCPKECGYKGKRGILADHIENTCPKAQLPCAHTSRGCTSMPLRGDYESHVLTCLYQPTVLKCNHLVNLKEEEGHAAICPQYPLSCPHCAYTFTRNEVYDHKCLPFLLGLITQQEIKNTTQANQILEQNTQIAALEGTIQHLNTAILNIEEKWVREIRVIEGERLIKCKICKRLRARSKFDECFKCHNNVCGECTSLCNKCHSVVCLTCCIPCHKCERRHCSCNITLCTKCNNNYCECSNLITCAECKQISCSTHIISTCQKCNQKYCSCTPLTFCIQCKTLVCQGCCSNLQGIGIACGDCIKQAPDHKLQLIAISATSNYPGYPLTNILLSDDNPWISKEYQSATDPSAEDTIILAPQTASIAITKFKISPDMEFDFNKMEIYLGMELGNCSLSHTVTQPQSSIILPLPHPIRAKFIKFKFIGLKDYSFVIFEVEIFGIQLAE